MNVYIPNKVTHRVKEGRKLEHFKHKSTHVVVQVDGTRKSPEKVELVDPVAYAKDHKKNRSHIGNNKAIDSEGESKHNVKSIPFSIVELRMLQFFIKLLLKEIHCNNT